MTEQSDLTSGKVASKFFRLAGPMVFGMAAVLSQSLVDTYFVGKLGTDQLAALSFSFPVALVLTSLSIGLSAGAASVLSRVIGEGNNEEARCLATDGLLLATAIVSALSIVGALTIEPLFGALGATEEVMPYLQRYMPIWYVSMPFLVVGIVGHGTMRANGEGNLPSAIMVGSALLNVILTPALMYGWWLFPVLDIEGVAIATLVSRITNLVVTIAVLYYGRQMIRFRVPSMEQFLSSSKRIAKIAAPAGAGNVVNPVGVGVVTALLATYGATTVAAFGVATRIEAFACLPMMALSSAMAPFAGQNWGAGKKARVIKALKISYIVCVVNSLALVGLFWLAGEPIASWFSSEIEVTLASTRYLQVVAFSFWGYGFVIVTASALNGIGKSVSGFLAHALRMLALYIPLPWVASIIADVQAIYVAIAISNGIAGTVTSFCALWWLRRQATEPAKN